LKLPAAIGPVLVSRIKIMANMNIVDGDVLKMASSPSPLTTNKWTFESPPLPPSWARTA